MPFEDDVASVHLFDVGDDVLESDVAYDSATMLALLWFAARYDAAMVSGAANFIIQEASEG
jgi:hypothetical protein